MKIENVPDNAKPSQIRPTADDVHTRNIKAIAEVVRQLRDDMVETRKERDALSQRVHTLEAETQQLKVQLIMAQHQGSGATAS